MLKLTGVTKTYVMGETYVHALRGVDITFRKSEFVAILGPSGCGKTTMLNIVGGLDRYTTGDLLINGKSTKHFTDRDWDSYRNSSVGFVFQNYNLIQHQTVLGNVELALTLSGISKAERRARAKAALESVGLSSELYKKPNQVSGGQMQRVAIARALVNNPEIILADEPTGALDSETSLQIMELLKEIARDRLVIMVTHNPELARRYATRTVRMLDGLLTEDSAPFAQSEVLPERTAERQETGKKKQTRMPKTSMSFLTALSLSMRNLLTKKARTFLTSFAGSIGIIGIALVLSISTGFQGYVDRMQRDTLAEYPLTIEERFINLSMLMDAGNYMGPTGEGGDYVYVNKVLGSIQSMYTYNNITQDYIDNAVKTIAPQLYSEISYRKDIRLHVYSRGADGGYRRVETATLDSGSAGTVNAVSTNRLWEELPSNTAYLEAQYEVLSGSLPTEKNHVVLYVDNQSRLTDIQLMSLGMQNEASAEKLRYDEIVGKKFRLVGNDAVYEGYDAPEKPKWRASIDAATAESAGTLELEIVGILRPTSDFSAGSMGSSIGYMPELSEYVFEQSNQSALVTQQRADLATNVLTGQPYTDTQQATADEQRSAVLRALGADDFPYNIFIYPVNFQAKEKIKEHLSAYNDTIENEEDKVKYSDVMETMVSSMNTVVGAISIVLISFTAISLVVSSIMIGIITYISVLERTKEIGILRSIGARKIDITNVFNAETVIVGFTAGLFGVLIALLLSVPINLIVGGLVAIPQISVLSPLHALALVAISMLLTFVAGMLPAGMAARKDPVEALRTE